MNAMLNHPTGNVRASLFTLLIAVQVFALSGCNQQPGGSDLKLNNEFFDDALWHDGKAEVSLYDATEVRYGKPRKAEEATLIVVKEDHRSRDFVKADNSINAGLPALKLNWVVDVPTGIYTYRQMASVFLDRRTGLPFRETFASHEWCGSTFKDLKQVTRTTASTFNYAWTSYFGSEGKGSKTVRAIGDALWSDALPVTLRGLPFGGEKKNWNAEVLPTLWANKAQPDKMKPAKVTVNIANKESINVPAGEFEVWRVEVNYSAESQEVYYIETKPPHRLIQMHRADGAEYKLRKTMRIDYWNHHDPGDESLRD